MPKTYIGLDPSLSHTGIVALDQWGRLLKADPIKTKPAGDWRKQAYRENTIVSLIMQWIGKFMDRPDSVLVCVEDYAPGRYMKTAIPTIELGGLLRLGLTSIKDVQFVSPSALKKFATGRGNADKLLVAVSLAKRFKVDFGGDDNMYDAYALAEFARAWDGHCTKLSQAQIEVVSKARKAVSGNGKR